MSAITQERLKQILHYDPNTGIFTWLSAHKHHLVGCEAGYPKKSRGIFYRAIQIGQTAYLAHRLAVFYMTGEWPEGLLDHMDRDGLNNRWDNIRPATRSQNQANKKCHSNSICGLKGVSPHQGRWRARIQQDKRRVTVGVFDTPAEAHAAYVAAAKKAFGEFARAA